MKNFVMVKESDLKKADRKALATLYLYWLENGKKNTFDLPLFVDNNGKGVMSVESFKRVFYAFQIKSKVAYTADIKSGSDGDDGSYNDVRLSKVAIPFDSEDDAVYFCEPTYIQPKKADVKRESSKKTAEKSAQKKATAEAEKVKAEAEADADWNKKASMAIVDHLIGKYKLTADRLTLETEIQNILNKIKA
jgi:hypothetical protein